MVDFISLDGFRQRHGITATDKDARIVEHIAAASARVRSITGRDFAPHSGAATARYFRPLSCGRVVIDDAYEITAVGVDDNNAGTYGTAWTTADYVTEPLNGVGPDGLAGWPTYMLVAVSSLTFPTWWTRPAVKVTAKWGWAAVPDAVVEACYLLAHRLFYEVSVPGGVTPPNVDFGIPGSALRRPYTAEDLLVPYTRPNKAIGVAG